MRCREILEALDRYRTGELPVDQRENIAVHLSACAVCTSGLAEIRGMALGLLRLRERAPQEILRHVDSSAGDRFSAIDTDLGWLWVGFNTRGITMVYPGRADVRFFLAKYEKRIGKHPLKGEMPQPYERAVRLAVEGKARGKVRVDLGGLSPFERAVLGILTTIPRGEVRPYEWLAREAGSPRAVRAVGNTMAHNPVPLLLPCHRVVPASGGIGKYAFGVAMKRTLLEREGVPLDQIEAYARTGVRYIGCRSTGIYCYPSCRDAHRIKPGNRVPLAGIGAANHEGFRPCNRCRPQ